MAGYDWPPLEYVIPIEATSLNAVVAVLGTLDTKGAEVAYLGGALRGAGLPTTIIDIGLRGEPTIEANVPRDVLMRATAESDVAATGDDERERAMAAMASGAGALLRDLHAEGRLLGVIAIGGSKGTWMATSAMRQLPWGVPKVMVASTVAGDLRRYAGHRDIVFMPTVVDLAGLNSMTRTMLARGAAALHGLIGVPVEAAARATTVESPNGGRQPVAMSMAGVVTKLGQQVQRALERRHHEVVIFPANGAGGMALEEAIDAGRFGAVVDLALLELANELVGGICSAGPGRLTAAGRAGVPQVVVPGAIEFANFPGPDSVPPHLRSREIVEHTPAITLVRLTARESAQVGRQLADKLNAATGPVELLVPERGFSDYDRAGGPFADDRADAAFRQAVRRHVNGRVAMRELDMHVNDVAFGEAVVAAVDRVVGQGVAA